jgi:hypothetical protein
MNSCPTGKRKIKTGRHKNKQGSYFFNRKPKNPERPFLSAI